MASTPPTPRLFICVECRTKHFRFGGLASCPGCEGRVREHLYDGDEESPENIRLPAPDTDPVEISIGGEEITSLQELFSGKGLNPLRIIDQSNKAHLVRETALVLALLDKGILTQEEWDRYRTKATHVVDQIWAEREEKQNQALERLRQRDPERGAALDQFFGRSDEDRGTDLPSSE